MTVKWLNSFFQSLYSIEPVIEETRERKVWAYVIMNYKDQPEKNIIKALTEIDNILKDIEKEEPFIQAQKELEFGKSLNGKQRFHAICAD